MSLWAKQQHSAGAWAAELPHGERSRKRGAGGCPCVWGLPGCRAPPTCKTPGLFRRGEGRGRQTLPAPAVSQGPGKASGYCKKP